MCQSCQLKPKADPKLSRHRKIQCLQRLTVSTKFYGIVNRDISSQHIANIYRGVSEVVNVAYFECKLRKIVFINFQPCFYSSIKYRCMISGVVVPELHSATTTSVLAVAYK